MARAVLHTRCFAPAAPALSAASPAPRGRARRVLIQCQAENGSLRTSRTAAPEFVSRSDAPGRTWASEAEQQQTSPGAQLPSGLGGDLPAQRPLGALSPVPRPPPTLDEIMAFDGVPELINGRLAMLGFVSGAYVEATQGVSFLDQALDPNQYGIFFALLATALISAASIIVQFRSVPGSPAPSFLFFTEDAEKANARVAMLGLVGVYLVEYIGSIILK